MLAVVLLISVGVAGGYLYQSSRLPGDNSPDAGFARDMSVHHAQAVEMGMYAFRISSDSELQIMGYDIATGQQAQIGEMQAWLADWGLSTTPPNGHMSWMTEGTKGLQADGLMPGMATSDEVNNLKSLSGKAFDVKFCQLMLRHHLGGVHMAEEALKLAKTQQIRTLAQQIQQGQELEITALTAKLKTLGASPL